MEKWSVIEKLAEPTEWLVVMSIVHKQNDKFRICLESLNLNKTILIEHFKLPTPREAVMAKMDSNKVFWKWTIQSDSGN